MRLNDDFDRPVFVDSQALAWSPSPVQGVDRRMLFRIGEEKAKATSIVRYAPGSAFPRHSHPGGEEILVLEGVFQDEHGDYPAGTYFRNPPGTSHIPASGPGCTIFVRLWQFRGDDVESVVLQPGEGHQVAPRAGGEKARILHLDGVEEVRLESWRAGAGVTLENQDGVELLVLRGELAILGRSLGPSAWGRIPPGAPIDLTVGAIEAEVWLKFGPPGDGDRVEHVLRRLKPEPPKSC